MDSNKILILVAVLVLYVIGALFMKGTHPYSGTRKETFETKQQRRSIGTVLLVAGTLLLGIFVLTEILIAKN